MRCAAGVRRRPATRASRTRTAPPTGIGPSRAAAGSRAPSCKSRLASRRTAGGTSTSMRSTGGDAPPLLGVVPVAEGSWDRFDSRLALAPPCFCALAGGVANLPALTSLVRACHFVSRCETAVRCASASLALCVRQWRQETGLAAGRGVCAQHSSLADYTVRGGSPDGTCKV
eukprot:724036-Prymnesium_polylepis.1